MWLYLLRKGSNRWIHSYLLFEPQQIPRSLLAGELTRLELLFSYRNKETASKNLHVPGSLSRGPITSAQGRVTGLCPSSELHWTESYHEAKTNKHVGHLLLSTWFSRRCSMKGRAEGHSHPHPFPPFLSPPFSMWLISYTF